MSTWGDRLAVFDLETTGVDVETSRIVSGCIAVLDADGAVVSRWNWLADPGIEIPEGASAVHGITTERARSEGRPAQLVVAEIVQTLRVLFDSNVPVTVYNAPYDLTLLDRECRRHGLAPLEDPTPVIDPLVIDKAVDRYRKGKRTLEVTARLYEVPLDDAHDAGADAIAAGRVALALLRRYPDDLDIALWDLHGRQSVWHAEQAASFQEYLRQKKGDDSFVADASWPLKPTGATSSFIDTQPIPPLPPRRGNVPILDFSALSVRAIESARSETPIAASSSPRFNSEAYRLASPPTPDEPFVDINNDDEEPAWIVEPSSVPLVTVDVVIVGVDVDVDVESAPEVVSYDIDVEPSADDEADREEDLDRDEDLYRDGDLDDWDESDEPLAGQEGPEPMSAADAVGEPEQEAEEPSGPPQAVLRVAAAIVTDPDGRCLLVRKAGTSVFMQAGGKLEPGESAVDALARELREELDLELDESSAEYLGVFRADAANEPHTQVSAAVFALATAQELAPHGEIEELLWVDSLDDVVVELAPLTRDELLPLWAARREGVTLF